MECPHNHRKLQSMMHEKHDILLKPHNIINDHQQIKRGKCSIKAVTAFHIVQKL